VGDFMTEAQRAIVDAVLDMLKARKQSKRK
jgi:hypothetical protein